MLTARNRELLLEQSGGQAGLFEGTCNKISPVPRRLEGEKYYEDYKTE